jgi:alpha-ribazole phosphatase
MTNFWLIRHGEPVAEARGRCYGSLDIGLSDEGRAQMQRVAGYLAQTPVSAIYSSPLSRALNSARIVAEAQSCPVRVIDDFREISFGDFEGLNYDEIAARYPEIYRAWMEHPTKVRFPKGESYSQMRARVLHAFDEVRLATEARNIVITSHGGVNRILISWALKVPEDCIFRIAQDYGAINLLAIADQTPVLRLLNHRPDGEFVARSIMSSNARGTRHRPAPARS